MKLFVSGKWEDKLRVRKVHKELIELGHEITYDWTTGEFIDNREHLAGLADNDITGVKECDKLVTLLFVDYPYKGVWVEFGIALALNKEIIVVGDYGKDCIFINHPNVTVLNNLKELYEYLKGK